jgi:hypothetical protein
MTSTINATIDLHRVSMVDRLSDPLVIDRIFDVICKHNGFVVNATHHFSLVSAETHTFVVSADLATLTLTTFPARAYAVFHIHTFTLLDTERLTEIHHFLSAAFGARRAPEYINVTESFFAPGISDALDAYSPPRRTAPIPIPLPTITNPFEDDSNILQDDPSP